MLSGQAPIFSQFGQNIYASDVVQQAVSCIVQEISKLSPTHVRDENGIDRIVSGSNVQRVLNFPNEVMCTSDFLEKVTWNLFLNYNSFVLPTWNGSTLTGLYPLQPTSVTFLQDPRGKLFVDLKFRNGEDYTLSYSDIIHIRKNYAVNDLMGGNDLGQPDNGPLLQTLELNNTLLQGVAKALKSSFMINGVIKYNTLIDDNATEEAIARLEEKIKRSESGFLPLDLKGEYIPITKTVRMVDATTLKFIDEKILRNFGVSLPILTGDYTKEQYEAFYQKTLEPLIIKLGQAFTKGLFTNHESNGFGNKIVFYSKELVFMNISQKLEMIRLLGDSGALYENEKRVAFGLKPLPELDGVRKQSLNYVDTNIANRYQVGNNDEQ